MAYRTLAYDAISDEAERLAALVAASGGARLDVSPACKRQVLIQALLDGHTDIVVLGLHASVNNEITLVRRCLRVDSHAQVVYVGAREDFVSEIYDTPHVGFLLRPISQKELDAALRRAVRRLADWQSRPVLIRTVDGEERAIQPHLVSHVESDRRLLRIHIGNNVVETYGKKSDLAALLPESFVQCHRSHLVNLGCVNAFGKCVVMLTTGEVVPVSRKRFEDTREAYRLYLGRGRALS